MSGRATVLALMTAGVLIGGCAGPTPATTPGPTPAPPTATATATGPASSAGPLALGVVARDLSFTPRALEAPAGGSVMLTLTNDGRIVHNLTIDALGVAIVVSPGQARSVEVDGLAPGEYPFYCSVSGHRQAGMSGTLTVR